MRYLCWAGVVTLLLCHSLAAQKNDCLPRPEVKAEIDQMLAQRREIVGANLWHALQEPRAKALAARYPADIPAHLFYLQLQRSMMASDPDGVRRDYQNRASAKPADRTLRFLAAYSLIGRRTADAMTTMESLKKADPSWPWPHLALSQIYGFPAFLDDGRASENAMTFLKLCPDSTESEAQLARTKDPQIAAEASRLLRLQLAKRQGEAALTTYQRLWKLELTAAGMPGREEAKQRITQDVARIRSEYPQEFTRENVLLEAARLTGDTATLDYYRKNQDLVRSPADQKDAKRREWDEAHRLPADATLEQRQAHFRERRAQAELWVKESPENILAWSDLLYTLARIDTTTAAELKAVGDQMLRLVREYPQWVGTSGALLIAREYLSRKVNMDEVPALLELGQRQIEEFLHRSPATDALPPESGTLSWELNRAGFGASALISLGRLTIEAGQLERVRPILAQIAQLRADLMRVSAEVDRILASQKAAPGQEPRITIDQQRRTVETEIDYQLLAAALARAEKRNADALSAYEAAWRATYKPGTNGEFRRKAMTAEIRELWKQLGGTDEGWTQWQEQAKPQVILAKSGDPNDWRRMNLVLPTGPLKDLSGQVQTLAKWKGKTLLVNVWATWCPPCREELPHLQKLYEKIKGRSNIGIVTLNIDSTPALVAPFMQRFGFDFPVLHAEAMIEKLTPNVAIPMTWIVDRDGVLRWEDRRYEFNVREVWMDRMLTKLAEVSGAAITSKPE